MNKNLKLICTVSILINLLLAGALAGMSMDKRRDMPWEKVKEGLSPESQKLVTKMFQDTWKDMSSVMRQSMENRKYLAEVVAADEFDPAKFDEAVQRIQGVQNLIAKRKIESTKELLQKLPPEDRKMLAEQVANSFSWRGRGKRPHNYPRPPGEEEAPDNQPGNQQENPR